MTPLRLRMLEDMQIRNLSPHTQRAYIESIARFVRHFGRAPAELGPEEIRTYQHSSPKFPVEASTNFRST